MRHKSAPQLALATRDRILDAAMLRFSRYSYEETGLRDVAADVGIDVAYVHRCFGSKQNLFAESLAATIQAESLFDGFSDDPADALARQIFVRDGVRAQNKVGPPDIIIRFHARKPRASYASSSSTTLSVRWPNGSTSRRVSGLH